MAKLDPFTKRRITRFVEDYRKQSGQLPTLKDFEAATFTREQIDLSIKEELLEQFYLTLTNGSVVKVFKLKTFSL